MKLSKYRVLRKMGCGPFTAGSVAFFSWVMGHPPNLIGFMHTVIEFDPNEDVDD